MMGVLMALGWLLLTLLKIAGVLLLILLVLLALVLLCPLCADVCWEGLMGRTPVRRVPTQAVFEPLVAAPQVSVSSRVVYILRRLIAGGAARMSQLFARSQSRSTNVATFLALLELVRGGRVTLGPKGELTMQRGRLPREKAKEEE